MKIKKLTAAEIRWLERFQELMRACPSKRLGAYTVGDADLTIYDKPMFDIAREEDESKRRDARDDVSVHADYNTVLYIIHMPFQVDGVAG